MSLDELKRQIQERKDIKDIKEKLGILASLEKMFSEMIGELRGLKESQSNEVVVKNFPNPIKEVTVSNFPEQKDTVKIDGDVSLKQPKWFTLKGIEKSIKTLSERIEKAVFKVDLDKYKKGSEALAVKLVDQDGKPYTAKGGGAFSTFGSVNVKNASGVDISPATEAKQDEIISALGGGVRIKKIDESLPYTYIGEATVGTATSAASWRVKRVDDTSDPDSTILYAGTGEFDQVWDDRATLTYN